MENRENNVEVIVEEEKVSFGKKVTTFIKNNKKKLAVGAAVLLGVGLGGVAISKAKNRNSDDMICLDEEFEEVPEESVEIEI